MRKTQYFLFLVLLFAACSQSDKKVISTSEELIDMFKSPVDSIEIFLEAGDYFLSPTEIIDSTCGNCQDMNTLVPVTAGLQISGRYVKITGPENHTAVIHTNSGYGLFVKNCSSFIIENVVITDGERDTNGMASDAAIVVKNSNAIIRNNIIRDNIGDSAIVVKNIVGIMGICGRENSDLKIENNKIIRNSWDGIALYRGAKAIILDNMIDGVDKATSKIAGGGRGVAVGVTWNAEAVVERNLIKRYWKGLGCFVDANVTAKQNIIEDLLTWGIAYWDAGTGKPSGIFEDNVIYSTGACGVSIASEKQTHPGRLTGNVIINTAQNPKYDDPEYYCYQCALSIHAQPNEFEIDDNLFYNNRRATDNLPDLDISADEFNKVIDDIKSKVYPNKYYDESMLMKYLSAIQQ